jgi:hypothetical protein
MRWSNTIGTIETEARPLAGDVEVRESEFIILCVSVSLWLVC